MNTKVLTEFVGRRKSDAQSYERHDALSLEFVWAADYGSLSDGFVGHQGTLDLGGSQAVSCDVEDIVDTADDPEVSVLVTPSTVSGEIASLDFTPILLLEAGVISINGPQHRRPGLSDDEFAAFVRPDLLAVVIHHRRIDAEERKRGGSRLESEWRRAVG